MFDLMFIVKLVLIFLWFIAGVLLFAKSVVVDLPFLAPLFSAIGLIDKTEKVVTVKVVKEQNPVVEEKDDENESQEEEKDDNELETVQIFKKKIKARETFYGSLTEKEKDEFRSYFVDDVANHLVKDLVYKLRGDNDEFFEHVFNYIYIYRKLISFGLLVKLTDELIELAEGDEDVLTLIYEAATRVAYYRRKDKAMLAYAEKLATLDVALQQKVFNAKDKYVYSFTRLAIILERKGEFKEALALVNDALKRNLSDRTKTGYEGRKERLIKRSEDN
jgi:tetratricopeptide (TPR) repeat protein